MYKVQTLQELDFLTQQQRNTHEVTVIPKRHIS